MGCGDLPARDASPRLTRDWPLIGGIITPSLVLFSVVNHARYIANSFSKIWNLQVYSVDWSPDGSRVASGGKDKVLKM